MSLIAVNGLYICALTWEPLCLLQKAVEIYLTLSQTLPVSHPHYHCTHQQCYSNKPMFRSHWWINNLRGSLLFLRPSKADIDNLSPTLATIISLPWVHPSSRGQELIILNIFLFDPIEIWYADLSYCILFFSFSMWLSIIKNKKVIQEKSIKNMFFKGHNQ